MSAAITYPRTCTISPTLFGLVAVTPPATVGDKYIGFPISAVAKENVPTDLTTPLVKYLVDVPITVDMSLTCIPIAGQELTEESAKARYVLGTPPNELI